MLMILLGTGCASRTTPKASSGTELQDPYPDDAVITWLANACVAYRSAGNPWPMSVGDLVRAYGSLPEEIADLAVLPRSTTSAFLVLQLHGPDTTYLLDIDMAGKADDGRTEIVIFGPPADGAFFKNRLSVSGNYVILAEPRTSTTAASSAAP